MNTQVVTPSVNPYLRPLLHACGLNFNTEFYLIILAGLTLPDERYVQVVLNDGGHCNTEEVADYGLWRRTKKYQLESSLGYPFPGKRNGLVQHTIISCGHNTFVWSSGGCVGNDGLWVDGYIKLGITGRGSYLSHVAEQTLFRMHLFSALAEALLAAKMAVIK